MGFWHFFWASRILWRLVVLTLHYFWNIMILFSIKNKDKMYRILVSINRWAIGAGFLSAGLNDIVRGRKIEQAENALVNEPPAVEQSEFKEIYQQITQPMTQRHTLLIRRDSKAELPYALDSFSYGRTLLVLPADMIKDDELAMVAHEAAHNYGKDSIIKDFVSAASVIYCAKWILRSGSTPFALTIGIAGYFLSQNLISQQLELRADSVAVSRVPSAYPSLMSFFTMGAQLYDPKKHSQTVFNYFIKDHPSYFRRKSNLQKKFVQYNEENSFYPIREVSLGLHHTLMMQKDRLTLGVREQKIKLQHPLASALYENSLVLDQDQKQLIQECFESARIYILSSHELILREFYAKVRTCSTPLGEYYRQLSFEQFLQRLIHKRYATAYLNGGMLKARNENDCLGRLLSGKTDDVALNRHILQIVGTDQDSAKLYQEYLSLDEIALSGILLAQAMVIPIADGRREYEYLPREDKVLWNIEDILPKAIPYPIVLSDIAGIECRDGTTLHYDLFMVAQPLVATESWQEMANTIRNSPFMSVAHHLFGDKLALNTPIHVAQQDPDFITIDSSAGKWLLCKPAYKNRLKHSLQQVLLAADEQMCKQALGTTFTLKGLGLGAFGFYRANAELETLYLEALKEVLMENKLIYIRQINLINFPSDLENTTLSNGTFATPKVIPWETINTIQLARGVAEPLAHNVPGAGLVGGSHVCGDSAALFGNEFHAGIGPLSSDESAIAHQILTPSALMPEHNPHLSNITILTPEPISHSIRPKM